MSALKIVVVLHKTIKICLMLRVPRPGVSQSVLQMIKSQ